MEPLTLTGNPDCVNPGFDCPPDNPLQLLKEWLESADRLKIVEPRGLVLSTINDCGRPSSRVVLMKTVDDTGVIFASSETSQKGKDLEKNPIIAGTLWWRETMQQINFCGRAAKLPAIASDEIFRDRTPKAQAVATFSQQSHPMFDEKKLREDIKKCAEESGEITRPETWHGYHITLESMEFWHGSRDRFHNRLRYDLVSGNWQHQKLQP